MGTHIFSLLLLILVVPSHGDITDCETSSKQVHYRLRNDLLCDYYRDIRPKMEHRNATVVVVKMIVQSFTYEMYSNTITVNSWMPIAWQDDHLQWKPSDYNDIETMHLSTMDIWTPDLSLYNRYQQEGVQRMLDSGVDCIVRYTGMVNCVPPVRHDAICKTDLRYYPYDTQKCVLRMGSWVHSGEEIDFQFHKKPVVLDTSVPNGEWKLLNVTVRRQPGNYECCPNNTYPSLIFVFALERLPSYHEATVIIPAFVIVILVIFTFSFNAADNERMYLILLSILFHFLFMQNLTWELPKSGNNTPNILLFARDSLILCMVQLITTLTLRNMIRTTGNNNGWVSGAVGTLIQSRIGQTILVFDNSVKAVGVVRGDEDGVNIIEKTETTNNLDYIIFAKLLDRVLCIIYIIIYISMYIKFVS